MSFPTTTTENATHAHEHLVEFYETDGFLVRSVTAYLVAALRERDAAIAIATPEHLERFAGAIAAAGVDVGEAIAEGRYHPIDAHVLLAQLTADGPPQPERFRAALGPLVERAANGTREVRIFGELVALLLKRGDTAATVAVEDMWNDLARSHRFELLCGYPLQAFNNDARGPFRRICERHTGVVPPERYTLMSDVQEQQRLVLGLRRDAMALRQELERLRREQEDLIALAYHDAVTGLANRRAFDDHLDREWALAARGERDSFVLIADLDDFKHLNDTYGHAAGDEVLREFADALRLTSRGTDVVGRIGGDEFAVLLVCCDERAVQAFRDRLARTMAARLDGRFGIIGFSLGHASLRHSSSPATALDRADLAMLAIKRSRRRRQTQRPRER